MPPSRLPRPDSWGVSWPLLVALTFIVGALLYFTSQTLQDPDTYMHLAIGYWIFQHQAVPSVDPFSYTVAGAPWIAHEWLAECLLAAVHHWAGWTGLVLLTVVAFALTLAYLLRFLLPRMPPIYALLFTALAGAPLATHLLARPHVLTWPILAVWLGSLVKASEEQTPPPWWLLGLMVLWANLHGSFTLGLALVAPFALESVLRGAPSQRWRRARSWSLFGLLAVGAAMVTPSGWKGIWFTFHVTHLKYLSSIAEWMPASSVALLPLELWLLALLGLAFTGYLRLPVIRLLLLLGLLHQALTAGRYISIFGLLTPLLIATPFGRLYRTLPAGQMQASSLDQFFDRLTAPAKPRALLVSTALVLLTAWGMNHMGRHAPDASKTAGTAVDAALRAGATGHVLNSYNFGGHLIFRGIPVFIDGRADLYGDQHMGLYFDTIASNKPQQIQKILDDFKISWTLLHPSAPILLYLNAQPGWKKVYEDETAVVHLRLGPQP